MAYQNPAYPASGAAEVPRRAVDPIISRLRPRDIGGILDQSFRLYRKHFLTFLAITAVVFVPIQIATQGITILLQGTSADYTETVLRSSSDFDGSGFNEFFTAYMIGVGALMVISIIGSLLQYVSQGALTSAVADSYMERPVSFPSAWKDAIGRIWALLGVIGLQLLIFIAIASPIVLMLVLAVGSLLTDIGNLESTSTSAGAGAIGLICGAYLLMIPAFIVGIYIYIRLSLVAPAVMVEELGPRQALRRSWQLVQNYWWRTFLLLALLNILSAVVAGGPAAVIAAIGTALTGDIDNMWVSVLTSAVTIVTGMIFIPIQLVATTLYYFDLRVRKEGFDIETAMAQAYGGQGAPYPQQGQPAYPYGYGQYAQPQGYNPAALPPALGYEQQQQSYGYPQQGYAQSPYPNQPAQHNPYAGYTPPPNYPEQAGQPTAPQQDQTPTAPDWLADVSSRYSQESSRPTEDAAGSEPNRAEEPRGEQQS